MSYFINVLLYLYLEVFSNINEPFRVFQPIDLDTNILVYGYKGLSVMYLSMYPLLFVPH